MRKLKNIATLILRFPVEETGVVPLLLLCATITALALIMRCFC